MMNSNNHIASIWSTLKVENAIGLVKRLYSNDINFLIYGTYRFPEEYYGVAFSFRNDIHIDISQFTNLREMNVMLFRDSSFKDSQLLIIELLRSDSRDIFAILCENLIQSVITLHNEHEVVRTVINQLVKWKTLFEKNNSDGLSILEQQGLFGELHFLQKCISRHIMEPSEILRTWVGVEKALRDFQGGSWAVEIKTTSTNNPQIITINGERQLDETLLENLFLFHISIEISRGYGETLLQKVESIRTTLSDDLSALNIFETKLFEVGFLPKHESLYKDRFYQVRTENYYRIERDFPRIKESELRNGVSRVEYAIVLSMCEEYLTPENQVLNIMKNYD